MSSQFFIFLSLLSSLFPSTFFFFSQHARIIQNTQRELFLNRFSYTRQSPGTLTAYSAMPPVIHLVRHAQGVHNLSTENHIIHDPSLTELGHEQCHKLRDEFPYHDRVELVTASPLRRTIYTGLHTFAPVFERTNGAVKLIALPDVQETSDVPCDTGSDPNVLHEELVVAKGAPVDLGLVTERWNIKEGRYAPTNQAIKHRAREARRWLKARSEKEIVLVTHGGFLHYLTEDWEDSSQFQGMNFFFFSSSPMVDSKVDCVQALAGETRSTVRSSSLGKNTRMTWRVMPWMAITLLWSRHSNRDIGVGRMARRLTGSGNARCTSWARRAGMTRDCS